MDLDAAAMPPPEGIDSNFDDPANQNGLAWGVLIACVAVATLSLFLRAYARVYLLRKVQAEEGTYALGPVSLIVDLTTCFALNFLPLTWILFSSLDLAGICQFLVPTLKENREILTVHIIGRLLGKHIRHVPVSRAAGLLRSYMGCSVPRSDPSDICQ